MPQACCDSPCAWAAWPALSESAESALRQLACECNSGCRLARIAWFKEESASRCEAQADLSQLPVGPDWEPFWRDLLPLAAGSLELILRRLGLELDVLADPANRALADRLVRGARARSIAATKPKSVGSAA